jgi:Tfp pilus assembly PilM family ATPase
MASEPTDMSGFDAAPPASYAPAPAPEYTAVFQAIQTLLAEFAAEVRRSIDYFQSRGGLVDRVELVGGGAKLRGLEAYLTKSLGVECDAYDPLRHLTVSAKKAGADFIDEHRMEFAIAVGNGLHAFFD